MKMNVRTELAAGVVLVGLLGGVYWLLHATGSLTTILDTSAILISPIPSAPIALAAGAAYGHGWGALYVLVGAEAGALAAFGLARLVGYETVHRWFGDRLSIGLIGSQNVLMGIVFVSRLLPFLSFDIVSYGAGLTVLSFWRFAIATLAGIAPTSFLLAHFGSEMATGAGSRFLFAVLALGGLTLVPIAVKVFRDRRARRSAGRDAEPR